MLVALYDETENDEDINEMNWQDFKDDVTFCLKDRKFPLQLIALHSNWKEQTGYAEVGSIDDILQKVTSFDSSFYELHKIGNSYEFHLSSHDVPTGFTIQIRSLKCMD